MDKLTVEVKRIKGGRWPLPTPATVFSAGVDLRADLEEPVEIPPGETTAVPTGIAIAIPDGWEAQVRPRSGLALKHSIGLLNSPGTIDADYRGEIRVIMTNFGKEPFCINSGDRIAQLVFNRVTQPVWVEVEELPDTDRGEGGFGHTGK
ncbi:dUTP diphosphatase [bacterium]|nr:dUTP diphosphatase [bacterium]MBU1652539.1 dUTP diphosphatase [bacterium]